jgi:Protein of unknown function (DUF3311)
MKYLLLLGPCVIALWTPFYNTLEPTLGGFPFFYWFLLILVPLSALFIYAADRVSRGGDV